jgi:hypothetical protein
MIVRYKFPDIQIPDRFKEPPVVEPPVTRTIEERLALVENALDTLENVARSKGWEV